MTQFEIIILVTAIAFVLIGMVVALLCVNYRGDKHDGKPMTKKKKWITMVVVTILLIAMAIGGVAWYFKGVSKFLSGDYREDVYIDVPDSDLTIVVKYWQWLKTGIDFYYVGENEEHVPFTECATYDECIDYYPFETGDYEVINNQNGTFTIRWNMHSSNTLPEKWDEITFDFPT